MSVVEVHRRGEVLEIELNRPASRNAIDLATAEAIADALVELDREDDLFVGILTGAEGTFSAGMDLKAFARGERPYVPRKGFAGFVESPPVKPLIAAVEGYALGGGFEMVLACDLVVAAESATFALPEVKRGLIASGGGLLRLPQKVPANVAAEWAFTGRFVTAAEAQQYGLVNVLAETGDALEQARELAATIAKNGPLAVRSSKQILVESPSWDARERFERQEGIRLRVRESADAKEGVDAFNAKRPPRWRGV